MSAAIEIRRFGRDLCAVYVDGRRVTNGLTRAAAKDKAVRLRAAVEDRIEVRRVGKGLWAVFRNDRRVSGPLPPAAAEDRAARMVSKSQAQRRPCITCRREFESEGPHNRMCDLCRDRAGRTCGGRYGLSAEPMRRFGS